jgi:hypothetical protein
LTAALRQAQEIISGEYGPSVPEDADVGDDYDYDYDYDAPILDMGRPLVVDSNHPSWPEVEAEQRERIGDPPAEDR